MATVRQFVREYVKAIRDGNAAVFAGAGLSRPSGFVVWKDLLRPLAEDIGLKIDDEHDLTEVAQYIRNKSGNRAAINASILDAYGRNVNINPNVRILTRLPIYTYWTTNYDHLIEEGLREANRNPDVKIDYKQLSATKCDRDAVVYKMHGDVEHAADAVLTKDDYVKYDREHPFFRSVLQGDLISKTFLFVGFSFEDPNLDAILSQIKLLLDENIRNHYCFMKTVTRADCVDDEDYGYQKARQDLREEDLKRYGIQTIFVDHYGEITDILSDIEDLVLRNNVFISASISDYDTDWPEDKVNDLAYTLANELVKNEFRITSGFGLGIGSSVINGALDEIYESKYKHLDEHLCLRPFPQNIADPANRKARWTGYREEIIAENGIAIFMFGQKVIGGKTVVANGCLEEFEIAKKQARIIIPIGSTGYAAKQIWQEIKNDLANYTYLSGYMDRLGQEKDIQNLTSIVLAIAKAARNEWEK